MSERGGAKVVTTGFWSGLRDGPLPHRGGVWRTGVVGTQGDMLQEGKPLCSLSCRLLSSEQASLRPLGAVCLIKHRGPGSAPHA